jgi:hypothetical protein
MLCLCRAAGSSVTGRATSVLWMRALGTADGVCKLSERVVGTSLLEHSYVQQLKTRRHGKPNTAVIVRVGPLKSTLASASSPALLPVAYSSLSDMFMVLVWWIGVVVRRCKKLGS